MSDWYGTGRASRAHPSLVRFGSRRPHPPSVASVVLVLDGGALDDVLVDEVDGGVPGDSVLYYDGGEVL